MNAELWESDGSSAGTVSVNSNYDFSYGGMVVNGHLMYVINDAGTYKLWSYTGTVETIVHDFGTVNFVVLLPLHHLDTRLLRSDR